MLTTVRGWLGRKEDQFTPIGIGLSAHCGRAAEPSECVRQAPFDDVPAGGGGVHQWAETYWRLTIALLSTAQDGDPVSTNPSKAMAPSSPPGLARLRRADAPWRGRACLGGLIGALHVLAGAGDISAQENDVPGQAEAPATKTDQGEAAFGSEENPLAPAGNLVEGKPTPAKARAFRFGAAIPASGESRGGQGDLGGQEDLGGSPLAVDAGDRRPASTQAFRFGPSAPPSGEGRVGMAPSMGPFGLLGLRRLGAEDDKKANSDGAEQGQDAGNAPIEGNRHSEAGSDLNLSSKGVATPDGSLGERNLTLPDRMQPENALSGPLSLLAAIETTDVTHAAVAAGSDVAVAMPEAQAARMLALSGSTTPAEALPQQILAPGEPALALGPQATGEGVPGQYVALGASAGELRDNRMEALLRSDAPMIGIDDLGAAALAQSIGAIAMPPSFVLEALDTPDAPGEVEPAGEQGDGGRVVADAMISADSRIAGHLSTAPEGSAPMETSVGEATAFASGPQGVKGGEAGGAMAPSMSELELRNNRLAALLPSVAPSDAPQALSLDLADAVQTVSTAQPSAQPIDAVSIARTFALEALGETQLATGGTATATEDDAELRDPDIVTLSEAASPDRLLGPKAANGSAQTVEGAGDSENETLSEAILAAISDNPDILSALARRDDAKYAMRQSRAALLPSVDLTVSSGLEGTRADEDAFEEANRAEAQIALRQLVWDFGAVGNDVKRARLIYEGVDWALRREVERVAFDVAAAYIGVLERQQLVALAQENLAAHERILETVRNQRQFGLVAGADVSRVEAKINAARGALLDRRSDLAVAKEGFRRQLNRLPGQLAPAPLAEPLIPLDVEATLELAETGNPELRQAAALLDSIRRQVAGQRAGRLPRFEVEAQGNWKDNVGGPVGRTDDARAMLTMRYKIFDGGAQDAAIARTGARLRQAQFDFDRTRRDIVQLVRNDYAALAAARDKVGAIDEEVQAGERLVELYIAQFRAGGRSVFDVLDSQETLINAKAKRITNVAAREVAAYRVLQNIGALFLTATGERFEPPRQKSVN